MASPRVDTDIEAQTKDSSETRPAVITDIPPVGPADTHPPSSTDPQLQVTNTDEHHTQKTTDNSEARRGENHGDSSDGLWSIYLTEAEKQDQQVIESWKGDADGILVFTGLFSATVAAFIIESYKTLSPDSSDMTNELLTQISVQLVNISNGAPLASLAMQSSQPFKPTASAVRVNVLWFLSLVLSLNCALSATLMQQWARRYQELAQRRGSIHRRGRMRAYIFYGIKRFGMARAVATMPTLLHISVFLFFAGLAEFLFPIYTTVAYTTLGCIGVFALAYATLTVLPNINLNCPYGTPLSGLTWRISHLYVFGTLWTILEIEGLFRKPLLKLWSLANQQPDGLKRWRETLESQVKMHRQWFSQGLRKSVELSAYKAKPMVVTSALAWTLTALDEDKEIEDFAARVPGFFNSRVLPDATSAVLSLMSHQPNTDPVFGSRLYDLLKTCIRRTSLLDERMRQDRLRACVDCLWYFGRAYNQLGTSQLLPSYFPDVLASPEVTRRVQAEDDSGIRVIGRCFVALIINKLATDLESRTDPISDGELACLSAIPGTERHDVELLLSQPGAVAFANMILLTDEVGGLVGNAVPSDVLDVVQQTLDILSRALPAQENAELQRDQTTAIIGSFDGKFEHMLVSRLHYFLNMCIPGTSPLTKEVRLSCLRVCSKGLWYFARALNQLGNSVPLPSYICIAFSNPVMTRYIHQEGDLAIRLMGRCIRALVVNKLAANIRSHTVLVSDAELACLSAILDTESLEVTLCLSQPGTVELVNVASPAWPNASSARVSSYVLDVVQQTFGMLSLVLPPDSEIRLDQADTLNVSDETSLLTAEMYKSVLHLSLKDLWHFTRSFNGRESSVPLPSCICVAFTNPEMTRRGHRDTDFATQVIRRCIGALVVNKLAADINSRNVPVSDAELACLSAILATKSHYVTLLLSHPGAIEFTNIIFLAWANTYPSEAAFARVTPDVLDVVQQTLRILSRALPPELNAEMRLDQADTLMNVSDGTSSLTAEIYKGVLHLSLKNLWQFTRAYNGRWKLASLPSYICIAFTNPEMTRLIYQDADPTTRAIARCVGALVVNKLAVNINSGSRDDLASDVELACLSAILATKSDDVKLLLSHRGAIELTNMVFLAWNPSSSASVRLPSDVLDVVQQTFNTLSQVLPQELNAEMRLDQTDTHMNVFDVEMTSKSILHVCMKNLWHFTYSEQGNSVSLPPYICIAFTNPEMTRRIYQDADLATQVIGRCIGALVVNKVAANFNSRGDLASDVEPACLSAILGTEDHNVKLLLSHRGSIELTNMVFLALDDTYFINESVPPDVPDVVQRTLGVLSRALPHDLGAKLRQDWSDSLTQVSDGGSSLRAKIHKRVSRMCLKALWHFTGDFVPLPSYICIAFSNPEMTRRIRERDPATRVMGRCIGALIITRLTAALKSKSAAPLAGDWEHACLSAILGTEGRDVGHYLSQPGTIELLSMASLAFSDVSSSLWAKEVLPDARDVLQQTLRILSKALPTQESLKLHEFHTDALNNISDNRFEHTIVSRLHALLRMCIPGASPLTEEVRSSCLWMTLKILWHCGTAYHQTSDPLPPYFHLVLASPEITRHFHSEQDPVLRMMGCCLRALIASKLVNSLPPKLTISLSGGGHHATHNAILACISAILGKGHRDVLLPYQLRIINFRNVVSLMSDEIDTLFTPAGMPADVLDIAEQTLNILVERFHATSWFIPGDLPMDQRQLLGKIYSTVMDSRRPNSLKETVQTLNQLQQVLEKLLPTVE